MTRHGTKNLIVFIDSLPFSYGERMPHASNYPLKLKVQPGLGYSLNIHWEIFGGLTPDQIGFFNEWTYDPVRAPLRGLAFMAPLFRLIRRESYWYRGLRRLSRDLFDYEMGDIPPEKLCYFRRNGETLISRNGPNGAYKRSTKYRSVLDGKSLKVILPRTICKGLRDKDVYEQAKGQLTGDHHLLLWFPDLDSVGHQYGVGSAEYDEHVRDLGNWVEELKNIAQHHHNFDNVLIFSDHGMANVHSEISLDLDENIGKTGNHSYQYFFDSTILRVWINNLQYLSRIQEYIGGLKYGKILSPGVRGSKGVASKRFGDLIFVLDEGVIFNPATIFANQKGATKAMHGYMPELESQKGILLSSNKNKWGDEQISTLHLCELLKDLLRE